MERLLFANIGWMIHYNGLSASDTISGGGSFHDDGKLEVYNFQNLNGWCYGYVQTVHFSPVNLLRIDPMVDSRADRINDVLVIWTARRPDAGGTYIVGWYKHATVFRTYQDSKAKERNKYRYNIRAKAEDCTLLGVDNRTIAIPRAPHGQEGGMGQSNIWYADKNIASIKKFRKDVIEYVYNSSYQSFNHKQLVINPESKKLVEETAVSIVREAYQNKDYVVKSVEKENIGWDLEARNGNVFLRIEVKGLAGEELSVHITPNEYSKMQAKDNANYRFCVVISALTYPKLFTFLYDGHKWVCEEDKDLILKFDEQVAAIAFL